MSEEIKMALVDRSRVVDERSLDRIIVSVCLPGLGERGEALEEPERNGAQRKPN